MCQMSILSSCDPSIMYSAISNYIVWCKATWQLALPLHPARISIEKHVGVSASADCGDHVPRAHMAYAGYSARRCVLRKYAEICCMHDSTLCIFAQVLRIYTESARDAESETMRRYEVTSRIYQLRGTRCTSAYRSADLGRQPLLVCIFYLARVYMQHEQSCLKTGARAYDSICA